MGNIRIDNRVLSSLGSISKGFDNICSMFCSMKKIVNYSKYKNNSTKLKLYNLYKTDGGSCHCHNHYAWNTVHRAKFKLDYNIIYNVC